MKLTRYRLQRKLFNWDWLLSFSGVTLTAYCLINLAHGAGIRPIEAISGLVVLDGWGWQAGAILLGFALLMMVFVLHIWIGMHYPQKIYNNRMMLNRQLSGSVQWPALIWTIQMITGLMLLPLCCLYFFTLLAVPATVAGEEWILHAAQREGWVIYGGILPLFSIHTIMGLIRMPAKYWLKGKLRLQNWRLPIMTLLISIVLAMGFTRLIG